MLRGHDPSWDVPTRVPHHGDGDDGAAACNAARRTRRAGPEVALVSLTTEHQPTAITEADAGDQERVAAIALAAAAATTLPLGLAGGAPSTPTRQPSGATSPIQTRNASWPSGSLANWAAAC